MIRITDYIESGSSFGFLVNKPPWEIVAEAKDIIEKEIQNLGDDFQIKDLIAIHKSVTIEQGVVLKGPIIISENCFVGAHAYLRGGVFLAKKVSIGPACEIKSSFIFSNSALAHFNFVGDSILGSYVNMEAGSIIANHHNDRDDKEISVVINDTIIKIGSTKFGALVGDHVKIGANAVLSPGTILNRHSIVGRLELIRQA
jgi:bifunctional N-acetylglucosamine-1-phosphate-uridyltransferase/glucosamine-1-phosphate-acetyltransferase GlmU-like protein